MAQHISSWQATYETILNALTSIDVGSNLGPRASRWWHQNLDLVFAWAQNWAQLLRPRSHLDEEKVADSFCRIHSGAYIIDIYALVITAVSAKLTYFNKLIRFFHSCT